MVHSCGAWLVAGMTAYILGLENNDNITITRENIFNLMIVLAEDIEFDDQLGKAMDIFKVKKKLPVDLIAIAVNQLCRSRLNRTKKDV